MSEEETSEQTEEMTNVPEGATESSGPDTAGTLNTFGIEIRGDMEAGFEDYVSARSTVLLRKLTRKFGGRIIAARRQREGGASEVADPQWASGAIPTRFTERGGEAIGDPSGAGLAAGLESGAVRFVANYDGGLEQTWSARVKGHMELHQFYQGYLTKLNEAGQDERVFAAKAPHVMHRVRSLLGEEDNLIIYRQAVSAGLFDLALAAMHNGPFFRQRGHGVDVYLTDVRCADEASIWTEVFSFLGDELGIPAHLFTAHVEVQSDADADTVISILGALGTHAIGIQISDDGDGEALAKRVQDAGGQVMGPAVATADAGASLPDYCQGFQTADLQGLVVASA